MKKTLLAIALVMLVMTFCSGCFSHIKYTLPNEQGSFEYSRWGSQQLTGLEVKKTTDKKGKTTTKVSLEGQKSEADIISGLVKVLQNYSAIK
jgi:hypothetical protein